MTIQDRFNPHVRRTLVAAGIGAIRHGHDRLDTDFLLLGLAEAPDATATLRRFVDPAAVRREIDRAAPPKPDDRELLATLGIDLDDVTRRLRGSTGIQRDDPRLWTLRRSPVRPLRLTFAGPTGTLLLTGQSRKVVEVAAWAAGRGRPIAGNHLLWGLLADATNESVRILRRLGTDLSAIWHDIRDEGEAA